MSDAPVLALYGHPFSSYTWKAQIALAAAGASYDLRVVDPDHPDNRAFLAEHAAPLATFPVLVDGDRVVFEATTIVEYVQHRFAPAVPLLPSDPDAAIGVRMLDRVFDNYVMTPATAVVIEHLRDSRQPDPVRIAEARERLRRSYAWLERWLAGYDVVPGRVTLIECAAAPSLFYADWIEPIGGDCPRLKAWRAHLLALSEVAACVEAARPYRGFFPPGAPDRD